MTSWNQPESAPGNGPVLPSQPEPGNPPVEQAQAEQEKKPLTFEDVNYQRCPNCNIGVLHLVTYDPEATHEIGQAVDRSATSGGAAQRRCFHCDYSDSLALNPGPDYGKGR